MWQSVPASMYAALLYDDENLDEVINLLRPYSENLDELLKKSSFGLSGELEEIVKKLALLMLPGFDRLPPCFSDGESRNVLRIFLENFTLKGRSPADDIIAKFNEAKKFDQKNYAKLKISGMNYLFNN